MDKPLKELLVKLTEEHGAPGFEEPIKELIKKEIKGHCDSVTEDNIGNLIIKKGNGKPVYMIAAHMDEIGLIIRHIDKKGFVWFVPMGGFYDPMIIGMNVLIHTDKGEIRGIIGGKPVHIMDQEERQKVIKWKDLYIDVGVDSRQDAEKLGVQIGQSATFVQKTVELAGNRFAGKAMDNRAGVLAMIEIVKHLKTFKGTLYAVGTVQEEVGVKGARVATFKLKPDFAFAIDVTFGGGEPGIKPQESDVRMGKGPSINYAEAGGIGLIANPKLNKFLLDIAKKEKIPIQLEATRDRKSVV